MIKDIQFRRRKHIGFRKICNGASKSWLIEKDEQQWLHWRLVVHNQISRYHRVFEKQPSGSTHQCHVMLVFDGHWKITRFLWQSSSMNRSRHMISYCNKMTKKKVLLMVVSKNGRIFGTKLSEGCFKGSNRLNIHPGVLTCVKLLGGSTSQKF